MRKLFSILVMICLSLLFFWAVTSWYFGTQAESEFRKILDNQTEKMGEKPFRLELLNYKKHVLGSSASVRVSSDMPLLNDWLGDFVLNLSSLNGPFFLTKKGVDIGASRWFIKIDPKSFNVESEANLRSIFPEELPEGVLIVGFDKESSFSTKLKTEWLESKVSAIYNLSTLSYRGSFDITKLSYASPTFKLSSDEGTIDFQYSDKGDPSQASELASTKTVSLSIPQLVIDHPQLSEALIVSTKGNSSIVFKNNKVGGFSNVDLMQVNHPLRLGNENLPIDKLRISAQMKGIQQSSFLAMMESKAEIDNLMMQTQWELDEHGEVPEGQDKIWQIQDQIAKLKKQYPMRLYKAVFPDENSGIIKNTAAVKNTDLTKKTAIKNSQANAINKNITLEMQTTNAEGISRLKGYLKPASENLDSTRFIDLFEAEAQVDLDDLLFSYISNKSAIRTKHFVLTYKQNKLLMH